MEIQTKWDLKKYYYNGLNDNNYNNDKNRINQIVDEFVSKYKGKIEKFDKAEHILSYYQDDENISVLLSKPLYFLFYASSLNTQDQDVLKQQAEIQNVLVNVGNKLLFVDQEFKKLGYENLIKFSEMPELKAYKNALVNKANNLKYILDEKQEFVLNKKSIPLSHIGDLFDEYHNSFMFEMEIDGEIRKMTEMEVRAMRTDADEEIRKQAHAALRKVYNTKQSQIVLGNLYSGIVKNRTTNLEIRGYESVMAPRNISEEMSDDVINMLMKSVHDAYPLFQRFLDIKRRFMKKETFYVWDILAPIGNITTKVTLDEAVDMHMDAMKNFDQYFYDYSRDMFEKGRVDVFPAEGKRGGAFCSSGKGTPVFVMLNFAGKINDVSTISHEFGHAIHGELRQKQPGAVYECPLSLCETASIFNELLLTDYLKGRLKPEEKIEFLNDQIGDAFATIFRQIQYVTFEKTVHERLLAGEGLTYEDYNLLWRETQVQMSGDKVVYDVEAKDESGWSMIPHIYHSPFYCYSYAFGNLLSFALYGAYQQKGKEFIDNYKEILSAGGSLPPKDLLIKYGFDITKQEFYSLGIKEIEKMIDEFESLLGE